MTAAYRTIATGGGTSGTGNRTTALTVALDDLLVVACTASTNTNASPTCTDDAGGTYTLLGTALWNTSASIGSVFVRNTLIPTASDGTSVTVTVATGTNDAAEIAIVAVKGMMRAGSAAIRGSGFHANGATSTSPTATLSANALTGNVTICGVFSGDTTTTPPSGWTERGDTSQATPTTALEVATRDSGFTSAAITFGATQSTTWGAFAIELDGSNPLGGAWPLSAAALKSALAGYGTWTNGWLCDDASGNLAATFGGVTMNGTAASYSNAGALASGDAAVGLALSNPMSMATVPAIGTTGFAALMAVNATSALSSTPAYLFDAGRNNGGVTPWASIQGFGGAAPTFEILDDSNTYSASTTNIGNPLGYFVVLACYDASTKSVNLGVLDLSSGEIDVAGSVSVPTDGNLGTPPYLSFSTSAFSDGQTFQLAYAAIATGTGAADGLAANMGTALSSLYTSLTVNFVSTTGSSSGSATVAGVLAALAKMTGSSSGTGTASGAMAATAAITGSSGGAGAASGVCAATAKTTGSTSGNCTVTGSVSEGHNGTGSSNGFATVTGTIAAKASVAGSASGTATVAGVLAALARTTGSSAGVGSGSGVVTAAVATIGHAAGSCDVSGGTLSHTAKIALGIAANFWPDWGTPPDGTQGYWDAYWGLTPVTLAIASRVVTVGGGPNTGNNRAALVGVRPKAPLHRDIPGAVGDTLNETREALSTVISQDQTWGNHVDVTFTAANVPTKVATGSGGPAKGYYVTQSNADVRVFSADNPNPADLSRGFLWLQASGPAKVTLYIY